MTKQEVKQHYDVNAVVYYQEKPYRLKELRNNLALIESTVNGSKKQVAIKNLTSGYKIPKDFTPEEKPKEETAQTRLQRIKEQIKKLSVVAIKENMEIPNWQTNREFIGKYTGITDMRPGKNGDFIVYGFFNLADGFLYGMAGAFFDKAIESHDIVEDCFYQIEYLGKVDLPGGYSFKKFNLYKLEDIDGNLEDMLQDIRAKRLQYQDEAPF